MNADSYYEQGAGHIFNQDYAAHGTFLADDRNYWYAVVSDGCSSSPDSDIGARFLAKSFPEAARIALTGETSVSLRENIEHILVEKMGQGMGFPLRPSAYDATLVALVYDEFRDVLHSFAWGDGKILYIHRAEHNVLVDIDYESNAPFYLSYRQDVGREILYEETFGMEYARVTKSFIESDRLEEYVEGRMFKQKFIHFTTPEARKYVKFASVFTDGVGTFHKKDNASESIPLHNVYNQLTQYKNTHGEFVKRRMQKVKQFATKEGWQHFDDIGVATISFGH